ncbi:MAG: hypothetical protein IRY98_08010 [Alicyclobacillaceae bacterium]|nr:hypothetical protein [Alicyclobacillaceae bacterium]
MLFTFAKAQPYAFFYEEAQLVLWQFDRDNRRDVYVLHELDGDVAVLEYPGETFTQRILEELGDIFFVSLEHEGQSVQAALGAVFDHEGRRYVAYYNREETNVPTVWFFRLAGDPGSPEVEPLDVGEHREIADVFVKRYGHLLHVTREGDTAEGEADGGNSTPPGPST